MKTSEKSLNEKVRADFVAQMVEFFSAKGEEVLRTASNEIALPVVDADGNGKFVTVTVKVPTGTRDGEPYDGYAVAEDYSRHLKEQAEKKAEAEAKKAAKIERDRKAREERAAAKAAREAKEKGE